MINELSKLITIMTMSGASAEELESTIRASAIIIDMNRVYHVEKKEDKND